MRATPVSDRCIEFARFGAQSLSALSNAIRAAKADALTPVTVCAPSNIAGIHLRRALAGTPGATLNGPGLVNIRFMVLDRLAELIATPLIPIGSKRLSREASSLAAQRALCEVPSPFTAMADSAPMVKSLVRTLTDLRARAPFEIAKFQEHELGAAIHALYRTYRASVLGKFVDEQDLYDLATTSLATDASGLNEFGTVILYLPEALSWSQIGFVRTLLRAGRASVIVGLTGEDCDTTAILLARELGFEGNPPPVQPVTPVDSHCAVMLDPCEESRYAVGEVSNLISKGIRLPRIAILSAQPALYNPMLESALDAEVIPFQASSERNYGQTIVGRWITGFLNQSRRLYHRFELIDWLCAAPSKTADQSIHGHYWGRIARDAGLTRGLDSSIERLRRYASEQRHGKGGGSDPDFYDRANWRAAQADSFAKFLSVLDAQLSQGEGDWKRRVAWLLEALDLFLDSKRTTPSETAEKEVVERNLRSLLDLDEIQPCPNSEQFVAAVESVLARPLKASSAYGSGVYLGDLNGAMALDFDAVIILGMCEGTFPRPESPDLLLAESLRPPSTREASERRSYLAARAIAPQTVFCASRVDRRAERPKLPSAWFLDEARRLSREMLYPEDLERHARLGSAWLAYPASFEAGIRTGQPRSLLEHDLRSLLAVSPSFNSHALWDDPTFRRGIDITASRVSPEFTSADGMAGPADWFLEERPLSASAIEQLARCPHQFFVARVLGIAETESPEDVETIGALDLGNVVHSILRRYGELQIAGLAQEDAPDHMARIANEELERFEAAGLVGRSLLWQHRRQNLLGELQEFVNQDRGFREHLGSHPVKVEWRFGFDPPTELSVGGDFKVWVRGTIDRIDRLSDGTSVIIDYKTGQARSFSGVDKDPLDGGRRLQLPLYAEVLGRESMGNRSPNGSGTRCLYWAFGAKSKWQISEVHLGQESRAEFERRLAALVGLVRQGAFPAVPGPSSAKDGDHCRSCPFNAACPEDRALAWERKQHTKALADFVDTMSPWSDGGESP